MSNNDIVLIGEEKGNKLAEKTNTEGETQEIKDAAKTIDNPEENSQQSPTSSTILKNVLIHDKVKKHVEDYAISLDLTNVTIDVAPGSNSGENYMGFIGKLTIKGTDQKGFLKTFHWIIKTAPIQQFDLSILNATVMYAKEAYVYEKIFPFFKTFQSEKYVLKPFDEHPSLILTHMEHPMESIVMEDMKSVGYVMADRQTPLDLSHVKLVMKTYAKLHALSYALKDQKPEIFNKFLVETAELYKDSSNNEETYKSQLPLMDSALECLDPIKDAKAIVKFKKFRENFFGIFQEVVSRNNPYSVFGHGDCWVNNFLWKYEDSTNPSVPTKICVLDWQIAPYGSPAFDLSYFLFCCTTKEFRDKYYDNMIKLYYYSLCGHLVELGSTPENILPYDALQQELKESSIYGVFSTVLVLYITIREVGEIPESINNNKYKDRVRGVIVDACEKGYFDFIE